MNITMAILNEPMKITLFTLISFLLLSCSENSKNFSSVEIGMTSEEVLKYAGQPDQKQDVGIADLWIYKEADRTVVFRKDTVYDIITSADARIDSIKTKLDDIGDKIEKHAEKAGSKLDSVSRRIKNIAADDTL